MEVSNQLEMLLAGTVHCESKEELEARLKTGRRLTIKLGFDPTAKDLHLGHCVVLQKLRQFQQLGHRIVFVVGDFTAMIGDPTGRNETRKPLTREEVIENAKTYQDQVRKILDINKTEIRFNSEWLVPLGTEGLIKLASKYTVARMLERDDFKKRFRNEIPISIHEFLYPLLQGYDSVAIGADVELGGSDQLFNLLVGRSLQKDFGQQPQVVLTTPLLEGTDAKMVNGVLVGHKMSKSLGNYIGVDEPPLTQFLKIMGISDDLMWRYYRLLGVEDEKEIDKLQEECREGRINPRDVKERLAFTIVERFHGTSQAEKAREEGNRWLRDKIKEEVLEFTLQTFQDAIPLTVALRDVGLVKSSSEGRRKILEGAVNVDGNKIEDISYSLLPGKVYDVRFGRKQQVKIKVCEKPS